MRNLTGRIQRTALRGVRLSSLPAVLGLTMMPLHHADAQRRERQIGTFADLSASLTVSATNQGVEIWAVANLDRVLLRLSSEMARAWAKAPAEAIYTATTKAAPGDKATDTSYPLEDITGDKLELLRVADGSVVSFYLYVADQYRVNTVMIALPKAQVRHFIDALKRAAIVTDSMSPRAPKRDRPDAVVPAGPSNEQLLRSREGKTLDIVSGGNRQSVELRSVGSVSFTVIEPGNRWTNYEFSRIESVSRDTIAGRLAIVVRIKEPPVVAAVAAPALFDFQVEKLAMEMPGNRPPEYPSALRSRGISGQVVAKFVVDTSGHAETASVEILKSDHDLFASAVRKALLEMRFSPAEVDGKKVRQLVQMPFAFSPPK